MAGKAIPVPSPAEVAALLDQAHILYTGFAKPRAALKTTKTATNKHDLVLRLDGVSIDLLCIGIIKVFGELAGQK